MGSVESHRVNKYCSMTTIPQIWLLLTVVIVYDNYGGVISLSVSPHCEYLISICIYMSTVCQPLLTILRRSCVLCGRMTGFHCRKLQKMASKTTWSWCWRQALTSTTPTAWVSRWEGAGNDIPLRNRLGQNPWEYSHSIRLCKRMSLCRNLVRTFIYIARKFNFRVKKCVISPWFFFLSPTTFCSSAVGS